MARHHIRPGERIVHVHHADGTPALWSDCADDGTITVSDDNGTTTVTPDEYPDAIDAWLLVMQRRVQRAGR